MKKIAPVRLYIKTHTKTGLKYFGKSARKNLESYYGSGVYWKKHIKKHGIEYVKTEWISEYFYYEEHITKFCNDFCQENNIVDDDTWANLKEENGLDGGKMPEASLLALKTKLTGRTKESHEYIRLAAIKQSKSMKDKNGHYQTIARPKINKWLESLSESERKEILGHEITTEQRLKLSLDRLGKTKENCDRVKKMAETKKQYFGGLSEKERKTKLGHTKGMKWCHNDELSINKLFLPLNILCGWSVGRKKYENKTD